MRARITHKNEEKVFEVPELLVAMTVFYMVLLSPIILFLPCKAHITMGGFTVRPVWMYLWMHKRRININRLRRKRLK